MDNLQLQDPKPNDEKLNRVVAKLVLDSESGEVRRVKKFPD
jgi:hypothetical protein